jgi:GNAT superfamily N-acetyltransferase
MSQLVSLVERVPSVTEYSDLIESVGFSRRDPRAIEIALGNSLYAVCASVDSHIVGCGRVIGDGALHLYLTDIIVRPAYQRQGIGTRIVASLTRYVESVPFQNTVVAIFPLSGLTEFYARHGYKAQGPEEPAMLRWINRSDA